MHQNLVQDFLEFIILVERQWLRTWESNSRWELLVQNLTRPRGWTWKPSEQRQERGEEVVDAYKILREHAGLFQARGMKGLHLSYPRQEGR